MPGDSSFARLFARFGARLRAEGLDRALADGAHPSDSLLLAQRAVQLTGRRMRSSLAAALSAQLEQAGSRRRGRSAAVPVSPQAVLDARPELRRLIDRLRDDVDVRPDGMARLKSLLSDGASPLYFESSPGALAVELRQVYAALDVGG